MLFLDNSDIIDIPDTGVYVLPVTIPSQCHHGMLPPLIFFRKRRFFGKTIVQMSSRNVRMNSKISIWPFLLLHEV
jgi:hypothetical protein